MSWSSCSSKTSQKLAAIKAPIPPFSSPVYIATTFSDFCRQRKRTFPKAHVVPSMRYLPVPRAFVISLSASEEKSCLPSSAWRNAPTPARDTFATKSKGTNRPGLPRAAIRDIDGGLDTAIVHRQRQMAAASTQKKIATMLAAKLGVEKPVIQAPMAGVSTVDLASQVANCGAIGSIPMSSIDLKNNWSKFVQTVKEYKTKLSPETRYGSRLPLNLNFFCHEIYQPPSQEQISNWCCLYQAVFPSVATDWNSVSNFSNGNVSFKTWELQENLGVLDTLFAFWRQNENLIPAMVSFHFGYPTLDTIKKFQELDILVFVTATSVEEVKVLLSLNIDGLVLQGDEAGGHRGDFLPSKEGNMTTSLLFASVQEYLGSQNLKNKIFLVPTGGIMDSDDVSSYIKLGASAVQMGSAFLATDGSVASPYFRKLIGESKTNREVLPDTIMTSLVSGKSARTIVTPFISTLVAKYDELDPEKQNLPDYGFRYKAYKDLNQKLRGKIEVDLGFHLAGQNYRKMEISSNVAEILSKITKNI